MVNLNPKMVSKTTNLNPKMASKSTNLNPNLVPKSTNLNPKIVSKSTNLNPNLVSKSKNQNPKRQNEVPCTFAVKGVHTSGNHHKSVPDFFLEPAIISFQSLTVVNVCQQFQW